MKTFVIEEQGDEAGVGDVYLVQALNSIQAKAILQTHFVHQGKADEGAVELLANMTSFSRVILTNKTPLGNEIQ